MNMENKEAPDPNDLLRQALTAPKYPKLAPFFKVVYTLRSKGMSWRDIAAWLEERGVEASHTTVRDLHKSELERLPEPVLQEIIYEIEKEADHLMVATPFSEEEDNDE
jgi:hypothetical protein